MYASHYFLCWPRCTFDQGGNDKYMDPHKLSFLSRRSFSFRPACANIDEISPNCINFSSVTYWPTCAVT